MTGILAPPYVPASAPAGVPALSDITVTSTDEDARIEYQSVGDIVSTFDGSTADEGDWLSPKSGMSGFEIRATLVSGSIRGGSDATSTWLNLGTTRAWKCKLATPTFPDTTAVLTIEIRPTGGAVAASCTVSMSAHYEP
jgi:hypothetical protein